MKKIILFVMLLVASFSFANTIAEEKADLNTTAKEIIEVSNDASSLETVYIEIEEDWTYCYTRVWLIYITTEFNPIDGSYRDVYADFSYTHCITID